MQKLNYHLRSITVSIVAATLFVASGAIAYAQTAGYAVLVTPGQVEVGQGVTVSYSSPTNNFNIYDTIIITEVGTNRYIDQKYLTIPVGTVSFTIKQPGTYVANYHRAYDSYTPPYAATSGQFQVSWANTSQYQLSATPASVVIGEPITVTYSVPANEFSPYDYIALYRQDITGLLNHST